MTIDEAIEHAEEQANIDGLCDCAMEHKRLAEWLKELLTLRTQLAEAKARPCRELNWSISTRHGSPRCTLTLGHEGPHVGTDGSRWAGDGYACDQRKEH